MALKAKINEVEFGVGDRIRVVQRIKEADGKSREAFFEGMVLGIKGRDPGKTFTVRRIAEGGIGVERIFPLNLPSIEKVQVIKRGIEGVRRAKLYYTREKSPTEIENIYKRSAVSGNKVVKRASIKRAAKSAKKKAK